LENFQGKLKEIHKEEYDKFKKQIEELGFSEPISVWQHKGKNYILNGHMRIFVLKGMRVEDYLVPDKIPCNIVEASDWKQAKKKVLALTSQYGTMTRDGLYEFLSEANISLEEVAKEFRFPEIDFDVMNAEFSESEAKEKKEGKKKSCPNCGVDL
jgi:ParB-like chromosome segregation protein Spo0J